MVYLVILFFALTIDFMVLNCLFYTYVKGDPSIRGRFSLHSQESLDVFLWPIIITLLLLIVYYVQYIMALTMGCIRLADTKLSRARKITFVVGCIIHFFFILCVLFGAFNRHFRNGGIQLFAYTVMNLYVFLLVVINWPVRTYFYEHEVNEEGGAAVNTSDKILQNFDQNRIQANIRNDHEVGADRLAI